MKFYDAILSQLKTKYAHLGLGDKALEGVARLLADRVTEEGQIENTIGGVEPLLQIFQSELDRTRNEKSGLQKQVEQLKKAEEERRKAEEEKPKKEAETSPAGAGETTKAEEKPGGTETPEQIFERLFNDKVANLIKTTGEATARQTEQIQNLTKRLQEQDEARAEAEKLAAYKSTADQLGIAKMYEPVVLSFASTAKDAQDFESMIKGFKQSLIDDASHSATPPETPLHKEEKEGEAIAQLINEGTRLIVGQKDKKE